MTLDIDHNTSNRMSRRMLREHAMHSAAVQIEHTQSSDVAIGRECSTAVCADADIVEIRMLGAAVRSNVYVLITLLVARSIAKRCKPWRMLPK